MRLGSRCPVVGVIRRIPANHPDPTNQPTAPLFLPPPSPSSVISPTSGAAGNSDFSLAQPIFRWKIRCADWIRRFPSEKSVAPLDSSFFSPENPMRRIDFALIHWINRCAAVATEFSASQPLIQRKNRRVAGATLFPAPQPLRGQSNRWEDGASDFTREKPVGTTRRRRPIESHPGAGRRGRRPGHDGSPPHRPRWALNGLVVSPIPIWRKAYGSSVRGRQPHRKEGAMSQEPEDDDLEPEYDFSGAARQVLPAVPAGDERGPARCRRGSGLQGFGVRQPGSPPPPRSRQARSPPEPLTLACSAHPCRARLRSVRASGLKQASTSRESGSS
jgi:hypothetical protein